jgi:hypothetical protein
VTTALEERLQRFLKDTDSPDAESVALRTLTLHMLRALAPRLSQAQGLQALHAQALERCATVGYGFDGELDPDRLQAGLDAWYCRHLAGLPHPPPDREALKTALGWLEDGGDLLYAWLLGELAHRCGLDVRTPLEGRPFLRVSRLHDAYFLTHLVMLDTDYFQKPLSHPEAAAWGDALLELVPWLARHPNDDLAGEVALCLRFMRRETPQLMSMVNAAVPTDDAHAQATVLLALSVE